MAGRPPSPSCRASPEHQKSVLAQSLVTAARRRPAAASDAQAPTACTEGTSPCRSPSPDAPHRPGASEDGRLVRSPGSRPGSTARRLATRSPGNDRSARALALGPICQGFLLRGGTAWLGSLIDAQAESSSFGPIRAAPTTREFVTRKRRVGRPAQSPRAAPCRTDLQFRGRQSIAEPGICCPRSHC